MSMLTLALLAACTPPDDKASPDSADTGAVTSGDVRVTPFDPYAAFLGLRGAWDGETFEAYGGAGEGLDEVQEPLLSVMFVEEEYFDARDALYRCTWRGRVTPTPVAASSLSSRVQDSDPLEVWRVSLEEHSNDCVGFDPAEWGEETPATALLGQELLVSFSRMTPGMREQLREAVGGWREDWDDYDDYVFSTWFWLRDPSGDWDGDELDYSLAYALDEAGDRATDEDGELERRPLSDMEEGPRGAIEAYEWVGLYARELRD